MDARDYMLQALEALQNGNRTWDAMDILIKGLNAAPVSSSRHDETFVTRDRVCPRPAPHKRPPQLPTNRPDTDSQQ